MLKCLKWIKSFLLKNKYQYIIQLQSSTRYFKEIMFIIYFKGLIFQVTIFKQLLLLTISINYFYFITFVAVFTNVKSSGSC